MDEFKVDFGSFPKSKADFQAMMKPGKRPLKILLNLLITAVIGGIAYYFMLPPMNFQATEFYVFWVGILVVYIAVSFLTLRVFRHPEYAAYAKSQSIVPLALIAILIVVALIGSIVGATIFRAKDYRDLIEVKTGNFQQDVDEISYNEVPRIDLDTAKKMGDKKLNELNSDLVSQFSVASNYTQINYKNRPVRVTPLQYGDPIKWLKNTGAGLPAYLMIDMVTQEVTLVQLKEGMRYSQSEYFNRRVDRQLRFQYPTLMFNTLNFEVDDNGTPFWIAPVIEKKIGLFGGKDIKGAVLMNAITGESKYYADKDVPNWVDRVYNADLIVEQYNYYGKFQKGFFNSILGQEKVTVTTQGEGYIALNDDVWMYTGITSIGAEQSNTGFILSNQRTKETKFYNNPGAQEIAAQRSAEGAVQDFGYKATFPLLLNIGGEPTYFMSLKDSDQLVKQYAMVNVKQYQVMAIGADPKTCEENYTKKLMENGITKVQTVEQQEISGKIADIRTAVKDGNTYYYIKLENDAAYFSVKASASEGIVIMNKGDAVKISFEKKEGSIVAATKIERIA